LVRAVSIDDPHLMVPGFYIRNEVSAPIDVPEFPIVEIYFCTRQGMVDLEARG